MILDFGLSESKIHDSRKGAKTPSKNSNIEIRNKFKTMKNKLTTMLETREIGLEFWSWKFEIYLAAVCFGLRAWDF